jgi:hypothetical protein
MGRGDFPSLPAQDPEALRNGPRRLVDVAASLSSTAHGHMPCRVDNLSRAGCRVHIKCRFARGTFLSLTFPGRGALGTRMVWSDGLRCGLEFIQPLHIAVLDDLLKLFRREPGERSAGPVRLEHWRPD